MMPVQMFGVLSIECHGAVLQGRDLGAAKRRAVLELLLLARGRPVTKDALAHALWDGHPNPPRDANRTLEQYVCWLRARLSAHRDEARVVIVTGTNSYRLNPEHFDIDLDRFDRLLIEAEQAPPVLRRELLQQAVDLARGDVLEDAPFAPWAEADRYLYRDRIARSHVWLSGDLLADGDVRAALRHAEEAQRFAPHCEYAVRLQMVAYHALGLSDMARSTFHRCRIELAQGLGVDPTSATVDIASAIDAGAPAAELIVSLTSALV
ncbi:MAG: winged helix-turn-helix domain-containing protein [Actinobacteria bacterium]|nr:winged helix-turn-helix domain-containing protein [Actinomycetota bacterium]